MATDEKHADASNLERYDTGNSSPSHEKDLTKVETHETLARVDIHNSQAFKGDDSDGKLGWHLREWFAAAFLAMLYTGARQCTSELCTGG